MKIAIMGIRGIPANYGGFETFADHLAVGLVERGHDVTVYCRSSNIDYSGNTYKGVKLVILPTIRHKYLDTVVHTFLCSLHSLFCGYQVILSCNSANSLFSVIPRIAGSKVVLNVDGLEWQRKKWNVVGKAFYKMSEYIATLFPNNIVTDARMIEKYYKEKFGASSTHIPYGAPTEKATTDETLKRFHLEPEHYVLYVSRLEPENNAHLVIQAFEKTRTDLRLVVVGDAPYSSEYIANLKKTEDPRIIFTGYVFGQGYRELQSNAYVYVQATEVGGTHPALLEGMGYGNCVLAKDVPEHREVLGDAGLYFTSMEALQQKLQHLLDSPEVVHKYKTSAVKRVEELYSWPKIVKDYEMLFAKMLNSSQQRTSKFEEVNHFSLENK
ncbi:MAG: DUF1972 domain-containing protein [Bacteroidetes bacterium]|nr:DUF1972 domain-containing protein [Bacteroidota bacterium]